MRKKLFGWIAVVLLFSMLLSTAAAQTQSRGILYRVTGGKNEMVLLGSIHVGSEEMYPLGASIMSALEEGDTVVFECDTKSAEAMQATMDLMSYPLGDTLQSHVSVSIFEELEKLAELTGYPLGMLNALKPWAVVSLFSLQTTAAEMGTEDISEAMALGVETQIAALARGRQVRYLETTQEQLEMMDGFSDALQEYMLLTTCNAILYPDQISGMDATLPQWPVWWRIGDADAFAKTYLESQESDPYPELMEEYHQQLITDRNQRMAQKLAEMLEEEGEHSYFVTVGLLHLVLPQDSVVSELEKMGYTVERVEE